MSTPSHFRDPAYLRGVQYKDASNVNARIALHQRFSTNSQGWTTWLFDRMVDALGGERLRILEVGCGPGNLWKENRHRVPRGWSLVLSDASAGMVGQATGDVSGASLVCDATDLPFNEVRFGAVVANHMLYHVGDRATALSEIRRVLDPGGCLIASTVGDGHLAEIDACLHDVGVPDEALGRQASAPFTLENAGAQLRQHFATVEVHHYDDNLRVTAVDPLIDYIRSMTAGMALPPAAFDEMRARFEKEIATRGFVWVTKSSGVFLAC